jgi:eukaryotic-like serine/threonine-protein kinase
MFCPECGTWNRAAAPRCVRCTNGMPDVAAPPLDVPDAEITALRRATGGRYAIVRRLASGGMAHVYEATHAVLGRRVVIKVLYAHLARDPEMRERFKREAEAASRLSHPNVCTILDAGVTADSTFVVLPFLPGGSLADRLARHRTVPALESAAIVAQVATGLDHAHRHGIVHRDVKPDNVLFDADGSALITDFGIATAGFHQRLTGEGRAMGTPHYMSPEQAMGKPVDGRSDVYACGVMLYEMLAGVPPFDGEDSYSVGYKHVHEMATPLDVTAPSTPQALAQITMRCLAKSAGDRPQRGTELADQLLRFMESASLDTPGVRSARLGRLTPAIP